MKPLYSCKDMPNSIKKKVTEFSYPTLINPSTSKNDRNYNTVIRKEAYLLWTSLGHSVSTDGRNLRATPIQLSKKVKKGKKTMVKVLLYYPKKFVKAASFLGLVWFFSRIH